MFVDIAQPLLFNFQLVYFLYLFLQRPFKPHFLRDEFLNIRASNVIKC